MSNVFQQIKEKTNILEVIAFYTEDELKSSGEHWYEMSDKSCPFCGHNDCFKVFYDGGDSNYHCFSCEAHGDQVAFVSEYVALVEKLEEPLSPVDAVKRIAKDFNVKLVIKKLTPSERLLNIAAEYYHNRLLDSKDTIAIQTSEGRVLMTPLEYQSKYRHHKVGSLVDFYIGYSDGELCSYLQSVGNDPAEIVASGLGRVGEDGGLYDFFPKGIFMYPHYKDGLCCSFTQKDPSKAIKFQFPGKFRLNDVQFFNQDSAKHATKVYVVEGENDVLSLYDAKADGAIIGTDGSIGAKQLDWMREHLRGKAIVTAFDNDQAGDKYRQKVFEAFPASVHLKVPAEYNDIDKFLETKELVEAFNHVVTMTPKEEPGAMPDVLKGAETPSVHVPQYDPDTGIVEKNGCYYRVKLDKKDEETLTQLTDFVIRIRNIFLVDGGRLREIEIIRSDGIKSSPMLIDSDTKVSLKAFRAKMADAVDGCYYGQEQDLLHMWKYVYKRGAERTVDIPDHIGDLSYDGKRSGWLFRNLYIKPTGEVVPRDKFGVMWVNGNSKGIRPRSISAPLDKDIYSHRSNAIPALAEGFTVEEMEAAEKVFVEMFTKNLGNVGQAMLLLGWAKMCAFSSDIFDRHDCVPFMHAWGGNGTGKTTLLKWLLSLYDMAENGYSTLPSLGSAVGFTRKMAYYSGLPMCLDEIRVSQEMTQIAGKLRGWYNRAQRDMAAAGSQTQIHEQPVRSVLLFGGQDTFTDPALRERCIVVRLGKEGREKLISYREINRLEHNKRLSSIGYYWIQESLKCDIDAVQDDIEKNYLEFLELGVSNRTAWTWGIIGTFSQQLCKKYFPEFDLKKYLLEACLEDSTLQSESSTLNTFYEVVEGMTSKEFSALTCEHFMVKENKLYIWFHEVYRLCMQEKRDYNEETFTKAAIKSAMKEEAYFVSETTVKMGKDGVSRRVVVLNLEDEKTPMSLKNIAEVARRL